MKCNIVMRIILIKLWFCLQIKADLAGIVSEEIKDAFQISLTALFRIVIKIY